MASLLIRFFLGTRKEKTDLTTSWAAVYAANEGEKTRDGILVKNGCTVDIEVNDNDTDTLGWYRVAPGDTVAVMLPGATAIYAKLAASGSGTAKFQQFKGSEA